MSLSEIDNITFLPFPNTAYADLVPSVYQSSNLQVSRTRPSNLGSKLNRYALLNAVEQTNLVN